MPELTIISGTLYDASGAAKANARLIVRKVVKGGVLVSTRPVDFLSDEDGLIEFEVHRDSVAYIDAPVVGLNSKPGTGVALTIPDAATADLEDLVPATSTTLPGASQAALNAHAAKLANPDDAGHVVNVGEGLSLEDGVISLGNLDSTFATDAQLTAEASLREQGDADALSSANAYTDAELAAFDLSLYQARAEKNQANGYAGLDPSGLIPDIRIPASIARDSEVSSAVAAEAALRDAADTAEATARDAAIATASTADRARANHTGTQSADTVTDGTTNKAYTAAEKTKLTGVETGATANSPDATLLARANHTGTQLAATISDFNSAALSAAPAETITTAGALISGATSKPTPADADTLGLSDSAASNVLKKLTWANLKSALQTYFDTLYQAALTFTGTGNTVRASSPTIVTPTIASFANANHDHANSAGGGQLAEGALNLSDVTTANASSTRHGFLAKLSNSVYDMLRGDGTWARGSQVLFVAYSGANSGTGETDLASFSLPAGILNADGKALRITASCTLGANANLKTVRLYFGATQINSASSTNNNTGNWFALGTVIRTGAATQNAVTRQSYNVAGNETANNIANTAPAENTAGAVTVRITGQSNTASNDVLLKSFIVELLN